MDGEAESRQLNVESKRRKRNTNAAGCGGAVLREWRLSIMHNITTKYRTCQLKFGSGLD